MNLIVTCSTMMDDLAIYCPSVPIGVTPVLVTVSWVYVSLSGSLCWEGMCCWLAVVVGSPLQFGGAQSAPVV